MVPADFANFFLATAGAGGALIGLLFVAISINPERTFSADAPMERQAVAGSAFTALVNAFFVSTAALIPGESLGPVAIALSITGLLNTLRVGIQLVRYQLRLPRDGARNLALRIARSATIVLISLVLYTFQLTNALDLTLHPATTGDVYAICSLILAIYGVGLTRAWELLGAPRAGFLSFLNPLASFRTARQKSATPAPPAPTKAADDTAPTRGVSAEAGHEQARAGRSAPPAAS